MQKASKTKAVMGLAIGKSWSCWLSGGALKWSGFGLLACILLSVIHLFLECFGFFFIHKRKSCQTIFQFKRMKERPVLVVIEWLINLLVPDNAAIGTLLPVSVRFMAQTDLGRTDTSTSFIQYVFPTRSFANTAAPCKPV